MYPYSDTDSSPRGSDRVKREAQDLIEQSKANIRSTDEPGDILENIKQGASVVPEDLDEYIKQNAKDFVTGTKRGVYNLKENTQGAAKTVKMAAENAYDTVMQKAQSANKATQITIQDGADTIQ
ncbi:MAG: hypothetical protein F6K23_01785 [Okeania sp. SIO2C9]|uniref:hypothetical protein n=1 Tax=Okeania sp. SIO2C9 TaxID=2607791 RepID=UPI0013C00735|nr:hypothetical protein [Okeania sp. SIO2C9]NEQ71919.1 hypothetical protein [Okeania sp. SIO2C9]